MPAIRIMTMNAQCLPLIAMIREGQDAHAEATAEAISDALLGIPVAERPDVIAFNEVFAEDARDTLVKKLKGTWPHMVTKVHDGGVFEDSGLMLFSRYAFLEFPFGGKRVEAFYEASEDTDAKAQKAVCIVQIAEPVDRTTIAFTHLQASYETEDQYADVRTKQLSQLRDAVLKALNGEDGPWGSVVLLGDLNVRGDPDATSGEWSTHFAPPGEPPFDRLLDGWITYMHEPGMAAGKDDGVTNIDYAKGGLQQRLDYICTAQPERQDITLKPQHMRVKLRGVSDHYAFEAVLQRSSAHCTPADAHDFLAIPPGSGGTAGMPTTVRAVTAKFEFDGSWQWYYVKEPGTYSRFHSPDVVLECYLASNFSEPVEVLEEIHVASLDPALQAGLHREGFSPRGETFVTHEPFFVAARRTDMMAGTGVVGLMQHHGETAATAIALLPHIVTESSFPVGQSLGASDRCWFKARMPMTFTGVPHDEPFQIQNDTGTSVAATLKDEAEIDIPGSAAGGAGATLDTSFSAVGDERIFLVLARSSQAKAGFRVLWNSPVCYLDLDQEIFLYINRETGIEAAGSDEPEMDIGMDNADLFSGTWDDADTGERWPGLAEAIRARCATRLPGKRRVGFIDGILVTVFDPDIGAIGVFPNVTVKPLAAQESDRKQRVLSLTIPDDVFDDGRYSFGCTLSRYP